MSASNTRLVIVGASGHGRVVADVAEMVGYEDIVFLDDDPSIGECHGHPVIGAVSALPAIPGDVFVAVGDAGVRRRVMQAHSDRTFVTLVHPSATVARYATIGGGTVVMAGAVVNPGARVGRGCIVNTCASVDHDCAVGDFAHVAVGARLCGGVAVGEGAWVGAGATVINNLSICASATIGAGAVVVSDVIELGTYVGIPARLVLRTVVPTDATKE